MFLVALENILTGTEVNIDYGADAEEVEVKPLANRPFVICECGSDVCTGVLWPQPNGVM